MPLFVPATPDPAATARLGRLLRASCLLLVAWMFFCWGLWRPLRWPGVDYYKHWDAAQALFHGESLYYGPYLWMGFNYPQAAAYPFFWLALVDIITGAWLWKMMLLGTLIGCWVLAITTYRPRIRRMATSLSEPGRLVVSQAIGRHWVLALAVAHAIYMPAVQSIYIGNIDPVNGLLIAAMVGAMLARREGLAGVIWALVTLIKLMPIVLLAPAILWRRGRLLVAFAATLAAYHLFLLLVGRLDDEILFYREIAPMVPRWWRDISHTPMRFALELGGLSREFYWNPSGYMIATRIATACVISIYLGLIAWLWLARAAWMRAVELTLIYLPFLTPLLEYHHFVYALPALVLQLRRFVQGRMRPGIAATLLAGWVMLQVGFYSAFMYSMTLGAWQYFPSHVGGLIILLGAIADWRSAARDRAGRRSEPAGGLPAGAQAA